MQPGVHIIGLGHPRRKTRPDAAQDRTYKGTNSTQFLCIAASG